MSTSRIVAVIDREVSVAELTTINRGMKALYGDGLVISSGRWTRFEVRTPGARCWCLECEDRDAKTVEGLTGDGMKTLSRFMVVCPECGNKRCPRASDHNEGCTGSNEPGQVGSRYGISRADVFFAEAIANRASRPPSRRDDHRETADETGEGA